MSELIKFSEEKAKGNIKNLIPYYINTARCKSYFWYYSKEHQDWIRGSEISESLNRAYENPKPLGKKHSSYKK